MTRGIETLSEIARSSALAPFRIRNYRFQWPADLLTSWAFEMELLILSWYVLVETGSVLLLTLFASLGYVGTLIAPMFGVVGDRIGHRDLLAMMRAHLRGARHHPDDAGVHRPSQSAARVHHCHADGAGAAVRSRRARRAGRHHHAARPADRRDQRVAHHHGYRAHCRRAVRRRAVRRARHGPGLCRDRHALYLPRRC